MKEKTVSKKLLRYLFPGTEDVPQELLELMQPPVGSGDIPRDRKFSFRSLFAKKSLLLDEARDFADACCEVADEDCWLSADESPCDSASPSAPMLSDLFVRKERRTEEDRSVAEEYDSEKVIAELARKTADDLRAIGLSDEAIEYILNSNYKLSRLHVNRHGKIFLTDYGNEEVKLYPKEKALFFLFLRHPEGINQKDLADHRRELLDLYLSVCKSSDMEAARQTVERLVNPFCNEANSSITKIKEAFVRLHRDAVSRNYYITGKRGEQRSITLDRDLVTWETLR